MLTIPSSALIFNAKGLSVATVGGDNRVVVKPVTVARDLGKTIEIRDGLNANDKVIESPPDGIANGTEVRIAAQPQKQPAAGPQKADQSDASRNARSTGLMRVW